MNRSVVVSLLCLSVVNSSPALAAGELSEHELADWLRERIEPA